MSDQTYTIDELEELTVRDIKIIAKTWGIPLGQRKTDLIDAIIDAQGDHGDELDEDEDELDEDEVIDEDEDLELDEEEDDEIDNLDEDEDEDEDDEAEITEAKKRHPAGKKLSSTPAKPKPASNVEPTGETYTAKQVATRIGTDAKELRKFFRSNASTIEPVGQGGRYEFDKADLPKIKAEFEKWQGTKTTRTRGEAKKAVAVKPTADTDLPEDQLELDEEEFEDFEDEELELDEEEDE